MTASAPLEPRPAPAAAARTSFGAVSLIKAADSRILALEGELRRREGELAAASQQLAAAQASGAGFFGRGCTERAARCGASAACT